MTRRTMWSILALLALSCSTGTVQPGDITTYDPGEGLDTTFPDMPDVPEADAGDVAWDTVETPVDLVEILPDYPDAWDIPDLDVSAEVLDSYPTVYEPTDTFPIVIPDNFTSGVSSTVEVTETGTLISMAVYVALRHPTTGDLRIIIRSPAGTAARLHNHGGAGDDDILTLYPDLTLPVDDLSRFVSEDVAGTWTLTVADDYASNVGQLEEWALYLRYGP